MKWIYVVVAVVAATVFGAEIRDCAEAFHGGWTGNCDGCHSQNRSTDGTRSGQPMTSSEICLRCHAAAKPVGHQVATYPAPPKGTPPGSLTPGGDFSYLRKDYYWTEAFGERSASPGETHGHNIVAPAYGYVPDATLSTAPGGSYPSEALSCISCHDPHGNYRLIDGAGTITRSGAPIAGSGSYGAAPTATEAVGTYRLLAGKEFGITSVNHVFKYDPPIAVAPEEYNRPETETETRVAYGKGANDWCANCHDTFSSRVSGGNHLHPSGIQLGESIAGAYNRYVGTSDFSGRPSSAFTSLVPFQTGEATNLQQLAAVAASLAGPRPEDMVICLTCHRAHASAWDSITRWNTKGSFLTVGGDYPGIDVNGKGNDGRNASGKTRSEYRKAMYDRNPGKFASYQRSLCNKCHTKD